jgi:hypothetical protein
MMLRTLIVTWSQRTTLHLKLKYYKNSRVRLCDPRTFYVGSMMGST